MAGSARITPLVLVANVGSSSVRCAVFGPAPSSGKRPTRVFCAHADRTVLRIRHDCEDIAVTAKMDACDVRSVRVIIEQILVYVLQSGLAQQIVTIGHRIVHGGDLFTQPRLIDQEVLVWLRQLEWNDIKGVGWYKHH